MPEDTARAVTPQEAAGRLAVNIRTIYRLIDAGELRAVRVGRVWRIPMDALQEYLARANNVPHPTEGEKGGLAPVLV